MFFSFKQFIVPNLKKRLAFLLPSIIMMGISLSFLIEVDWGTDPASFMNQNICQVIGLSFGTTLISVNVILFLVCFFLAPKLIGFGTLANMLLIGIVADFCINLWLQNGLHSAIQNGGFFIHLLVFAAAILIFVFAAAIYMNSQTGTSPYDSIPIIIQEKLKRIPFFVIRMAFDLGVALIGVIVSRFNPNGMQGCITGSIAMSFLLGPVIQAVGKPLQKIL